MTIGAIKAYLKKNRKKALLIYLGWCLLKGVAFLVFGIRLIS